MSARIDLAEQRFGLPFGDMDRAVAVVHHRDGRCRPDMGAELAMIAKD